MPVSFSQRYTSTYTAKALQHPIIWHSVIIKKHKNHMLLLN